MGKRVNKSDDNITMFIIAILLGMIVYFVMQNHTHKPNTNVMFRNVYRDTNKVNHNIAIQPRRINIPTRGELPAFKNIGYLHNANQNSDNELLALYGRPTYRGSDKWNYYTMHEGVRVPVENCDKPRGCKEKYQGDGAVVDALGENFKVGLYKDDAPRYIPY